FQLARADLDAGQLSADRIVAEVSSLLRRRLQSSLPVALQRRIGFVASLYRTLPPALPHFCARQRRPPSGLWRTRLLSARSSLARLDSLPRILSWRQRRRHRRQPPDGLDRPGREAARAERRIERNARSAQARSQAASTGRKIEAHKSESLRAE